MNKTDAQLEYIIKDCYEAIEAYPSGYKTPEYYSLAKQCEKELFNRDCKRAYRTTVKNNCADLLTVAIGHRWRKPSEYSRKMLNHAIFSLGFNRLHS